MLHDLQHILEKTSFIQTLSNLNERSVRYLVARAQWKRKETDSWMNYFPLKGFCTGPVYRKDCWPPKALTPGWEREPSADSWARNLSRVCMIHRNSTELFTNCLPLTTESFTSSHTSDSNVQDRKFSCQVEYSWHLSPLAFNSTLKAYVRCLCDNLV